MVVMDPISLASSIVQFVDFSVKVVSRVREFSSRTNETPETFRTLIIQLPLLTVILQRIRYQAVAGQVEDDVARALKAVVDETADQVKYLGKRLEDITPPRSANGLARGLAALRSIVAESRVEKAVTKIHECVDILVLHQSTNFNANIINELKRLGNSPQPKEDLTALLHEAARQGQISSIRSILRLSTDVNAPDECGRTALHTAAANGQKETARRLCFWRADVNVEDDFGQTPLHLAIEAGEIEVAKVLVDKGALQIKDDHGKTPLDYAAPGFLTRWRIQHGFEINVQDARTGNTALTQAAYQGEIDAVLTLIEEGADVNAKNNLSRTALALACLEGHDEIVSVLLDNGANPNGVDTTNCSPFMHCVKAGDIGLCKLMLDSGKINLEAASSTARRTALLEATYGHRWDIVELLLQRGANPNVICPNAKSPLRLICFWCVDAVVLHKLIELAVEKGVDLKVADADGWTPTAEAVQYGRYLAMELLLKHGATPNGRVYSYPYICRATIDNRDTNPVRVLVRYKANIEATNSDGWTALREAVGLGGVNMVDVLLELGADPNNVIRSLHNCPGHDDVSILMHAVVQARIHEGTRYRQIISALVSHGAQLEYQDTQQWTPLRMAIEKDYEDVACLLLQKGADPKAIARDGRSILQVSKEKNMREFCSMVEMKDVVI